MKRCGPRVDGDGMSRTDLLCEPPLELRGPWAGRQPARAEDLDDRLDLRLADRRTMKRDRRTGRHWFSRSSSAGTGPTMRAGTPTTTVRAGASRVTTAPAATSASRPRRRPGRIVAFAP